MPRKVQLVNLTPHPVHYLAADGRMHEIPPSGTVARCSISRHSPGAVQVEGVGQVRVHRAALGRVEDLPAPRQGVRYIVSRLVLDACGARRGDLLAPDDVVRDHASGAVLGCRAFARA